MTSPLVSLSAPSADDRHETATGLEALFIRRVLAEMRTSESSLFGHGFQGDMFKEMLDQHVADALSKSGGFGLVEMFEQQLAEPGGPTGAPPQAATPPGRARQSYERQSFAPGQGLEVAPVSAPAGSGFGRRVDPIEGDVRVHTGIDLRAAAGTPVRAAGPGVVTFAGQAGGYGNLVTVDHGGGLETRYAHLADIGVKVGQRVEPGAHLATVGATGRATGPHLHFEVRRDGRAVDPANELLKNPR